MLILLLSVTIFLPLVTMGLLILLSVLQVATPRTRMRTLLKLTGFTGFLCSFGLAVHGLCSPHMILVLDYGPAFTADQYAFEMIFRADRISIVFLFLIAGVGGLIGHFATTYMLGEPGEMRFGILLLLFVGGMNILVTGGTMDLLFVGWEFVGITSALLIAYFWERTEPVKGGLYAYGVYRVCDIGLLLAAVFIHDQTGTADLESALDLAHWSGGVPGYSVNLIAFLLVFAALGKSAQLPFMSWFPRAMEGPTPSSAIFYGALSIHAGAYLLLRTYPLVEQSMAARSVLVVIGIITAIVGTMCGRVQPGVKNQLAYATLVQSSLILAEIGLGFTDFALLHVVGHACIRTLQFLRAPSTLHDHHLMEKFASGHLPPPGLLFKRVLPMSLREPLYVLSLNEFELADLLQRFFVQPLCRLSARLNSFEEAWLDFLNSNTDRRGLSRAKTPGDHP